MKDDKDINDVGREGGDEAVRAEVTGVKRFRRRDDERKSDGKPQPTPGKAAPEERPPPKELPDGKLTGKTVLKVFNKKYMVVNEGGTALVFEPRFDPVLDRDYFVRIKIPDFKVLYINRKVPLFDHQGQPVTDRKGKQQFTSAAQFWLNHPKRTQYLGGVTFNPGNDVPADTLNLWKGFAIQPRKGSCQLLYDHIHHVICCGVAEINSWLLNWIARMYQKPAERAEVCIVLRSDEEGSGKSTLGFAIKRIFGIHAFAISDPRHLVGNFNAHLQNTVFLLCSEAFFAGDKSHIGTLKALITDLNLTIEGKYRNPVQGRNFLHIMMTTNADWVIPAVVTARRYLMLDVSSHRVGDVEYFRKLNDEIEGDGLSAFLYDMLHRDISQFNWRQAPDTTALQEQKKLSFPTGLKWWWDVLEREYVFKSKLGLEAYFGKWHESVATDLLYDSYLEFSRRHYDRFPLSREAFGKMMGKLGKPTRLRNAVVGEHIIGKNAERAVDTRTRTYGYRFGPLQTARKALAKHTGLTFDWGSYESDESDEFDESGSTDNTFFE
jgi:hypothetical protein